MRKCAIAVLTMITLMLCQCTNQTHRHPMLVAVDSLMNARPDSALSILQRFPADSLATKEDRAYYALLMTQAKDKNYVVQADDSLIRSAVRYYDSTHEVRMQARAYYLWGSVYRDRNEQAAAVEKYLAAIPFAEKANDKALLGRIYNNVGFLYYLQELNEEAQSAYQATEQIGIQQHDTSLYAEALYMQGKIGLSQKDYAKAEEKLLQAQTLINGHEHKRMQANVARALSLLYSRMGNDVKALKYARQNICLQDDMLHCYHAFLTLGEAYYQAGQYDSAIYYFHESLSSSSHGVKANAYMRLADIAKNQGDTGTSLEMERLYSAYKDSLKQSSQDTEMLKVKQRTDIQLQRAWYKRDLGHYLTGAIALIIIAAIMLLRNHIRQRKKRREQLKRENELRLDCIRQNELLAQKEREIECLKNEIVQRRNNGVQKETLEARLAALNKQHEAMIKKMRNYSDVIQKMENILSIYKDGRVPKEFLDENDWARLLAELDKEGRINHISEKYNLSNVESHLCGLLLLDYSVTDMGRIIQRRRMSIYRLEQSILKKMGIEYKVGNLKILLRDMVIGGKKQ